VIKVFTIQTQQRNICLCWRCNVQLLSVWHWRCLEKMNQLLNCQRLSLSYLVPELKHSLRCPAVHPQRNSITLLFHPKQNKQSFRPTSNLLQTHSTNACPTGYIVMNVCYSLTLFQLPTYFDSVHSNCWGLKWILY